VKQLRGHATLEIRIEAVNEANGRFGRRDMYVTVDGNEFRTTITQDQVIWNALPRAVRELLLSVAEENAECDESAIEREEILDERSASDVYAGVE
jgi:hypothetical protein